VIPSNKIILPTPERKAEAIRQYPALVLDVADAQDAAGATVYEVLNIAIESYAHVLTETGHEDIAAALRQMFDARFQWPERMRKKDDAVVLPVSDAIWDSLDIRGWAAMDYDSQDFGERAYVILYALALFIITGVSQIWGSEAADFVMGKLMEAGNWSVANVAEGLPGTEVVN
jgi:hypothetical protein